MPLKAVCTLVDPMPSQMEAAPALNRAKIDTPPVNQRWPRRAKASAIITITPAMPIINSGAMSVRLISGLVA